MEKWVTVRRGSAALEFRHRLTNLSVNRVAFTWNLHVAHPATPTTTVHVPAARMLVEPPDTGRFGDGVAEVGWPVHGGADVSGTLEPVRRGDGVPPRGRPARGVVRRRPRRGRRGARAAVRPGGVPDGLDVGRLPAAGGATRCC